MTPKSSGVESGIRLMLGGDVMLGRIVGKCIERFGAGYPLGPIAGLMRRADLTIVNLECAVTSCAEVWPGAPKAFYFGAPPQAVDSLLDAGVDLVSLANNHALDYGEPGLLETLDLLHRHSIRYTGAGADVGEAFSPALLASHGIRLGMAAFCDHQPDFAARESRPGIAYLDLRDEAAALAAWRQSLQSLQLAGVDWPILSLHWGPNRVVRPSENFRRLAHAAIDMGWRILFGHSAHVFQGIELHHGCPIIYAAGDLVDDYRVDPEFRNDQALLFELELTQKNLRGIEIHPVFIERCQTSLAGGEQRTAIAMRMSTLCAELGTVVQHAPERVWIEGRQ
jgi:poly-gamma-glutamate capsule biosynthesis protein CapA/YwtB (metallophosphatase superfamily)